MTEIALSGTAALQKALVLFFATIEDAGVTPLSVLAADAGIPISTAQRMIGVFTQTGLLSRVARGRYTAGDRLASLVLAADPRSVLIHASRDLVRSLAHDLNGTVHLGVLENDMVTYLVKERGGGVSVLTSELIQLEAYCSGIGKVLLAGLDEIALNAYLGGDPFVALTARTITNPAALRSELELVRAQGYACDDAEIQDGLYCLAVPVRGPNGDLIAALSTSKAEAGWQETHHLDALNACALQITARIDRRPQRPG